MLIQTKKLHEFKAKGSKRLFQNYTIIQGNLVLVLVNINSSTPLITKYLIFRILKKNTSSNVKMRNLKLKSLNVDVQNLKMLVVTL